MDLASELKNFFFWGAVLKKLQPSNFFIFFLKKSTKAQSPVATLLKIKNFWAPAQK